MRCERAMRARTHSSSFFVSYTPRSCGALFRPVATSEISKHRGNLIQGNAPVEEEEEHMKNIDVFYFQGDARN